jgi:hypothetical protein
MRACGPRSSEVGPSSRRLLTACSACLAVAVGAPLAAVAKGDRAAGAPAAAPAKIAKPVKDGSATRTTGKVNGGGKPGNGSGADKPVTGGGSAKSGQDLSRRSATPEGSSGRRIPARDAAPATVSTTSAPVAAATPPAATPVTSGPATPAPEAPPAPDTIGAPVSDRTPGGAPPGGAASLAGEGVAAGGPFGGLAPAPASAATGAGSDAAGGADGSRRARPRAPQAVTRTVVRTVRRAVEVIPGFLWALIAGLGALSLLATGASSFLAGRARRLARQREALLQDVGLLQEALLPDAPAQIAGAAAASVAYRAATSGPPGGDFYDVFALDEERLGLIVGRASATGRRALGVTALIRHILRAYLEGGLQPRNALQVGAEVLERHLGPDYACATIAVYDRATSRLTYAGAGMPAPIVLGSAAFEPVTACASPPIGMGVATGTRQTTVLLPAGAAACLYTDGLVDARVDGGRYGYRRAWHALETLEGDADADALLDRVAAEADTSVDDIAAVLLRVGRDVPASASRGERRLEELELGRRELDGERPGLFLRDCGVPTSVIPEAVADLRETATQLGGAVLRVRYGAGVPEPETGLRTMEILSAVAGRSGG